MAVTSDIVATYKGPKQAFDAILARGIAEPRALAFVMGGCALTFVAQLPRLSREAHLNGTELQPAMGGALLAWVFIAPLALYVLSLITHVIARAMGRTGDSYGARVALFWAFLAASPLMLLNGLVAGFIGPGTALSLVGFVWFVVFLWFWLSGLRAAYGKKAGA